MSMYLYGTGSLISFVFSGITDVNDMSDLLHRSNEKQRLRISPDPGGSRKHGTLLTAYSGRFD